MDSAFVPAFSPVTDPLGVLCVQVIKNTVIGATRDLAVASYFPQPASPVEAGRAFPQSASPVEAGRAEARKGYAGTVRTAFRSAVVQYLRVGMAPLLTSLLTLHLTPDDHPI
jgi:hypothetical protein